MIMFTQKNSLKRAAVYLLALLLLIGPAGPALADSSYEQDNFFDMSMEQLMEVEIAVASKSEEKLFETPAAAYVITAEDIRRSSATSVPDLLRMVPGLQVARINANTWAISTRGFNNEHANKLLVMIDGRSIYTPHFGGVHWDLHDVMLEDVERIEVIRGPGGTIWGSNAINGIINIITKKAKDTQGVLLSGTAGTADRGLVSARVGEKLGENTYARVYSKYSDRDDGPRVGGGSGNDDWRLWQSGFRIDSNPSKADQFTFQGDTFGDGIGHMATQYSPSAPISTEFAENSTARGGNLLGRWKREFSDSSDIEVQLFYDRTERLQRLFKETRDIYDIDFHHHFLLSDIHEITWGLGHRFVSDDTKGSFNYSLEPDDRKTYLYSAFAQDRITLVEDKLKLTVGSKIEHNEFTGFEYQPSGRLAYTPNRRNSIWAAVTKAVRIPMRFDRDSSTVWSLSPGVPTAVVARGNKDFDSEEVVSYELGYRTQASDKLMLDIAAFFNVYDDLRTFETGASGMVMTPAPHLVIPQVVDNKMDGETYGAELSATYQAGENWKLNAGYTYLQMQLHPDRSSTYDESTVERESPHNQFHVRSYLDLSDTLELDLSLNYVDSMLTGGIESYVRLDARLGWRINENMELSFVGQNLFDKTHPEFNGRTGQIVTEADCAFFIRLTGTF
jgi:iron complex outermembrane receptor protein